MSYFDDMEDVRAGADRRYQDLCRHLEREWAEARADPSSLVIDKAAKTVTMTCRAEYWGDNLGLPGLVAPKGASKHAVAFFRDGFPSLPQSWFGWYRATVRYERYTRTSSKNLMFKGCVLVSCEARPFWKPERKDDKR